MNNAAADNVYARMRLVMSAPRCGVYRIAPVIKLPGVNPTPPRREYFRRGFVQRTPTMRSHVALAFVALLAVTASAQEGAGTPRAGAAKRPNILFCIADDASGMHFSAYGCKFC